MTIIIVYLVLHACWAEWRLGELREEVDKLHQRVAGCESVLGLEPQDSLS